MLVYQRNSQYPRAPGPGGLFIDCRAVGVSRRAGGLYEFLAWAAKSASLASAGRDLEPVFSMIAAR